MNKTQYSSQGLFLKKKQDFDRVRLTGKRVTTSLFNVLSCPSSLTECRVGIVVSRRFGKAVRRNRAKRIFREVVRASWSTQAKGIDFIVFPRPESLSANFRSLLDTWTKTVSQVSLTTSHAQDHS